MVNAGDGSIGVTPPASTGTSPIIDYVVASAAGSSSRSQSG
jgi:hypothetical protein